MDSPGFDKKEALKSHKDLLLKKKERLEKIINTVSNTIKSIEGEIDMSKKDMFEGFDMTEIERHKEKYAKETEEKYGNTDAYKESQKKTSSYDKNDWAIIQNEADEIYKKIGSNMDKGPEDNEVQELVEEWRNHITKYYYNCTPEIFRGLGDMYVYDEKFTENIDKYGKGLAKFLRDAMNIYCDNLENR